MRLVDANPGAFILIVHVFEDRKRLLKFNLESWTVMEGTLVESAKGAGGSP